MSSCAAGARGLLLHYPSERNNAVRTGTAVTAAAHLSLVMTSSTKTSRWGVSNSFCNFTGYSSSFNASATAPAGIAAGQKRTFIANSIKLTCMQPQLKYPGQARHSCAGLWHAVQVVVNGGTNSRADLLQLHASRSAFHMECRTPNEDVGVLRVAALGTHLPCHVQRLCQQPRGGGAQRTPPGVERHNVHTPLC